MLVIMVEIHKMLARIANREDPESDLGLHCLSRPFWQATSVRNFRTFTVGALLCCHVHVGYGKVWAAWGYGVKICLWG